jgi:hypothetical protein
VHHLFVSDLSGEFVDVVTAIDQLTDVTTDISDAGFRGDDSFKTSGDYRHGRLG